MKNNFRRIVVVLGLAVTGVLAACQSIGKEPMSGVPLTGIDHLADHLSVPDFWVNGTGGFQAGTGGSTVCCARIPEKWHPGLTAHVKWEISDWKHGGGSAHEAEVPVDRYTELGHMWVHFLADGSLRVVVSNSGPYGVDYPGPRDPIPQKEPWWEYPVRRDRRDMNESVIDMEIAARQCASVPDPDVCAKQADEKSLDEQLADARLSLPPCASMAGDRMACARTAERQMRAARWKRRCQIAPGLPVCATESAATGEPQ